MPKVLTKDNYPQLLERVKSEIATAKQKIEHTKALSYWNIGRHIHKHLLANNGRTGYGERLFKRLSQDLKIHHKTLEKAVRFSREVQKGNARSLLSWTHYRALISVKSPAARRRLQIKAIKENLSSRELQEEINDSQRQVQALDVTAPPAKLRVKRGRLFLNRLNKRNGALTLDIGFNNWKRVKLNRLNNPKEDDIVSVTKDKDDYQLQRVQAKKSDIYTYIATVKRVVDGDTLICDIDCGFGFGTRQRLRLKGIDAPEVDTPLGKKAKRFVERQLKDVEFVVIKTYSSDKYDRYLTDVFYDKKTNDAAQVASTGHFLNQELLNNRLAVKF